MFHVIVWFLVIFDVTCANLEWDRYHPLEDFDQFLFDLEHNFSPSVKVSQRSSREASKRYFCQLEEVGRTHEDRPILLLKVCAGQCGGREVFWLDAGLHPREWIGPAVLAYLAKVGSPGSRAATVIAWRL